MKTYQNPVIKGYHPDPSMCFVGEDAYLVTSTFEFFPGVPIFHSKNLVDWECINHCLVTDEQLPLENCRNSGGIYAPTIRYHEGTFYMITTNVSGGGNFIVYTDDIRGSWSTPKWVDQKGIDPSLLFDDDGKVYFCGTEDDGTGRQGIVAFEINPKTGEILSDKKIISYGSGGKHPEAPHLYKINGYYYLIVAEGGTEYGHMVTLFRSKSVWGPFESCPHNPIVSNRNAMYTRVQCTGHADLAQDENGNWWLCCLGIRRMNDYAMLHHLGRETFLLAAKWEDGWLVAENGGEVLETMEAPLPGEDPVGRCVDFTDDFTDTEWQLDWNFVRNPNRAQYQIGGGKLLLTAGEETLASFAPTFVGIRQPEFDMLAKTTLDVTTIDSAGKAGIVAYYSKENYLSMAIEKTTNGYHAVVENRVMDMQCIPQYLDLVTDDFVQLEIETGDTEYQFFVVDAEGRKKVGSGKTAALCTEATATMTFTGTYIGLFASRTKASFSCFSLKEK